MIYQDKKYCKKTHRLPQIRSKSINNLRMIRTSNTQRPLSDFYINEMQIKIEEQTLELQKKEIILKDLKIQIQRIEQVLANLKIRNAQLESISTQQSQQQFQRPNQEGSSDYTESPTYFESIYKKEDKGIQVSQESHNQRNPIRKVIQFITIANIPSPQWTHNYTQTDQREKVKLVKVADPQNIRISHEILEKKSDDASIKEALIQTHRALMKLEQKFQKQYEKHQGLKQIYQALKVSSEATNNKLRTYEVQLRKFSERILKSPMESSSKQTNFAEMLNQIFKKIVKTDKENAQVRLQYEQTSQRSNELKRLYDDLQARYSQTKARLQSFEDSDSHKILLKQFKSKRKYYKQLIKEQEEKFQQQSKLLSQQKYDLETKDIMIKHLTEQNKQPPSSPQPHIREVSPEITKVVTLFQRRGSAFYT